MTEVQCVNCGEIFDSDEIEFCPECQSETFYETSYNFEKRIKRKSIMEEKKDSQTATEEIKSIKFWREGGDSFNCKLLDLMGKADCFNYAKLKSIFPELAKAREEWYSAESEESFFAKYNLK